MTKEEVELGKKLQKELDDLKAAVTKPNILIAGGTGVGKSSIINMVFGKELAVVGTGKPVTQRIDVYEKEGVDVRIYDSKGYELTSGEKDEFFEDVVKLSNDEKDPAKAIHMIWYCIQACGGRCTDYDFKAINEFGKANVPLAIVLTKSDIASDEDIAGIKSAIPESYQDAIFETSTEMPKYNQIDALVEWAVAKLPDQLKDAFIKSQRCSLESKKSQAHKLTLEHCTAAFGVGFAPIPMSDAPLLLANEAALIARILYLYDLDEVNEMIKGAGIGGIVGSLVAQLGKTAVANLIKSIPGVGTVVGGLISGSVGAALTGAIGEATSVVAYKIAEARLDGNDLLANDLIKQFGPAVLEYAKEWLSSNKKLV